MAANLISQTSEAVGFNRVAVVCIAAVLAVCLSAAPARAQTDPDVDRALAETRLRAERGNVVAQFTLGSWLFYTGADRVEGVEWIRRAARGDHAPAQWQLGQAYHVGAGVDQDDVEALTWYRRAADAGIAAAQRVLGDFHQQGRGGLVPDASAALLWYRRAADGDDLRAQYFLGDLYFSGAGVPRDYVAAHQWFSLAAGQTPLLDNWKALVELRNTAAARMSPDDINIAEQRTRAWRPRPSPGR